MSSRDLDRRSRSERGGLLAKTLAIGFWGTLAALIVSAATIPGFVLVALLPLLGMPYLLFCFIASTGDRNVE